MSEFDNIAGDWDKNLMHLRRSEAIAMALLNRVTINSNMTALEFGAGTGLLSFILKDKFSEIVMIDSSKEMIRITENKITESGSEKMKALLIDLEKDDYKGQFDILYSQMVLHHVDNIDLIFNKFKALIKPGGYLAIVDLYTENGSFHGDSFTGHKGFDVDQLTDQLQTKGFSDIVAKPCFAIQHENEKGEVNEYPVFLLTAIRD